MASSGLKPALLIAMLKKGRGGGLSAGEENPPESGEGEDDPLAVNEDMIATVKEFDAAKDPEARAQALKAFFRLCEGE